MIKSSLNVPALQGKKIKSCSCQSDEDPTRPSSTVPPRKETKKVENWSGPFSKKVAERWARNSRNWRRHRGSGGPEVGRKCWEFLRGGSCLIIVFKGVSGGQDMTEISHSAGGGPLHQSSDETVEKAAGESNRPVTRIHEMGPPGFSTPVFTTEIWWILWILVNQRSTRCQHPDWLAWKETVLAYT